MTMPFEKRLSASVAPWFDDAFTEHTADLPDLRWDLSLTTLPDPQRHNQFVSALTLYTQVPTGRGDEHVANTVMFSPGFDRDKVGQVVADLAESIRAALIATPDDRPQPDLSTLGNGRP